MSDSSPDRDEPVEEWTETCWDAGGLGVSGCEACPELVDARSQIVDGVGPEDADLLFVGEAPGADEDTQGEPFVGRSGGVLDDALRDVGLSREDVRITNCARCRPPGNRDPTRTELSNCRGYLEREIQAVDPELIITLGKVPGETLLDRSVGVTNEAGSIHEIDVAGEQYRVLVCVHPAATLYDPRQRETLADSLAKAVEYASDGGQSTLTEFD